MDARANGRVLILLVVVLLAGLPIAVWLDLRSISEAALRRQASDLNSAITEIRAFYSTDVVDHVLTAHGRPTVVTNEYKNHPGAIPIPATFSLELGHVIATRAGNLRYTFTSDFPFKHRKHPPLDPFERASPAALRAQPDQEVVDVTNHGLMTQVRLVAPVMMAASCVACHNSHPDSPKHDWKVGDVRGIQELTVEQPLATNLFSFRFLLLYFVFAGALGFGFIAIQRRQSQFLASIATKVSRYLSPQIYEAIFSGRADVTISTRRKKLTIFFSDIKDFTSTTERLQPEELTALLNEYFTEMSAIALEHGGTIDKFVGDAILVFFGDPETKGVAQDAEACLRMAVAMQRRLGALNVRWRARGIERPFRVRIGINTGYCNVGNFGSADRMDYTIIGAEANLAARLQSIAEAGGIVMSYETYALVRHIVAAHPLPAITVKGIAREIIPYAVDGLVGESDDGAQVFSAHGAGLDLFVDVNAVDAADAARLRGVLSAAIEALDKRGSSG